MVVKNWNFEDIYTIENEINRVERNIELLSKLFYSAGFLPIIKINPITWGKENFFDIENLNRIKENIISFNTVLNGVYKITLPIVNLDVNQSFDYKNANEIEKPIAELEKVSEIINKNILRCGQFNACENRTRQLIRGKI
ncbi:MAG: hypothetical protein RR322_03680 [Oscillospiraceae bacterium]